MKTYSKRTWLNPITSPSTGSCVSYHGPANYCRGGRDTVEIISFFEVSDCNGKVKVHRSDGDSLADFADKIRLLAEEAADFADFIDSLRYD